MKNPTGKIIAAVIIIMLIAIGILTYLLRRANDKVEQQSNNISALGDTLSIYKLKDSSQVAQIDVLMTERVEDILTMRSNDSAIIALQSVVEKYKKQLKGGGSVIVVKGSTNIKDSAETIITIEDDSIKVDSKGDSSEYYKSMWKRMTNPTYTANFRSPWYSASVIMKRDSSKIDLTVVNSYDVIVSKQKNTWTADVINHNPHASTSSMRAYKTTVKESRPKKFGLGFHGGYTYIVDKFRPYVGAGISWNPITF